MSGNLPAKYCDPFSPMQRPGLDGEHEKCGTYPQTSFQLCGLSFQPFPRPGQGQLGEVASPTSKDTDPILQSDLLSKAVYVLNMSSDSNSKTGHITWFPPGSAPNCLQFQIIKALRWMLFPWRIWRHIHFPPYQSWKKGFPKCWTSVAKE